eukprot:gene29313-52489_t
MLLLFDDLTKGAWRHIPPAVVPPGKAAVCSFQGGLRSGGAEGVRYRGAASLR